MRGARVFLLDVSGDQAGHTGGRKHRSPISTAFLYTSPAPPSCVACLVTLEEGSAKCYRRPSPGVLLYSRASPHTDFPPPYIRRGFCPLEGKQKPQLLYKYIMYDAFEVTSFAPGKLKPTRG